VTELYEGDWYPPEVDIPNPLESRQDEVAYYFPLHGDSMFEAGGKVNRKLPGHAGDITYKSYFLAIGFKHHVSVDFDDRWADYTDDLRKPLWEKFGQFDMFTNMGTSEHIEGNQAGYWENVHRMTKVGGLYIHLTPNPGGKDWPVHGIHYPTEEFLHQFAKLNGWVVEKIGIDRPQPHRNLYGRLRKIDDRQEFVMPDEKLIWFNARAARRPLNR